MFSYGSVFELLIC